MALPSSGPISIGDIQAEFGGSNPASLSEYYGVAAGVPTSGTISISDFYGASSAVNLQLLVDGAKGGDAQSGTGGYAARSAWVGTVPSGTVLTCAAGSAGRANLNGVYGGGGGGGSGAWVGSTANILCAAGGGGGAGGGSAGIASYPGRGYANAAGGSSNLDPALTQLPYSGRSAGGGNNGAGGRGGQYGKSTVGASGAGWGSGNGGAGYGTSYVAGGTNGSGYMTGGVGTFVSGDWGGSGGGGGYGGGGGGGSNGTGAGAGAAGGGIARSVSAVGATYTASTGADNGNYTNGAVRVYVSGVLVKTQSAGGTSNHTV